MKTVPPLPAAWLGYKIDLRTGDALVRICAWCPDRRQAEAEAKRLNCRVTHGICPACYQAQYESGAPIH